MLQEGSEPVSRLYRRSETKLRQAQFCARQLPDALVRVRSRVAAAARHVGAGGTRDPGPRGHPGGQKQASKTVVLTCASLRSAAAPGDSRGPTGTTDLLLSQGGDQVIRLDPGWGRGLAGT